MGVVGLIAAAIGLLGLVLKWWWGRRTKEQEILDAIHGEANQLDEAIRKRDFDAISYRSSTLRRDLRVLLRKKGRIPPVG